MEKIEKDQMVLQEEVAETLEVAKETLEAVNNCSNMMLKVIRNEHAKLTGLLQDTAAKASSKPPAPEVQVIENTKELREEHLKSREGAYITPRKGRFRFMCPFVSTILLTLKYFYTIHIMYLIIFLRCNIMSSIIFLTL